MKINNWKFSYDYILIMCVFKVISNPIMTLIEYLKYFDLHYYFINLITNIKYILKYYSKIINS
jgi:hypothetical protein